MSKQALTHSINDSIRKEILARIESCEWIQSPIVYVDKGIFANQLKALLPEVYSLQKGIYHYLHMANTGYRELLKKEQVSLKKYFYILRPLLAIQWIQQKQQPAPIEFDLLIRLIVDFYPRLK